MDKIAVIRLSSLGDIILTEPVIRNLKTAYPESKIFYFCKQKFSGALELLKGINDKILYQIPGDDEKLDNFKTHTVENNHNFDLLIDLHKNIRSRIIKSVVKAKTSVVYKKDYIFRQMAVWTKNKKVPMHTIDRYLQVLKSLGIDTKYRIPQLTISDDYLQKSKAFLNDSGCENDKYVVFAVGASHEEKRYPLESYYELAEKIIKESGYKVLIADLDYSQELDIFSDLEKKGVLGFATGLDIPVLAGVLKQAEAVISNDSGIMHLASGVGTPTIGLFGPTHPVLGFAPVGEKSAAISTEENCAPCSLHGEKVCYRDKKYCMINLTPDLIMENLRNILE